MRYVANSKERETSEESVMRAIMVMYDSLNRRMLEPHGSDWVKTPNYIMNCVLSATGGSACGGNYSA